MKAFIDLQPLQCHCAENRYQSKSYNYFDTFVCYWTTEFVWLHDTAIIIFLGIKNSLLYIINQDKLNIPTWNMIKIKYRNFLSKVTFRESAAVLSTK